MSKVNPIEFKPLTRLELREKYGGILQDAPVQNINLDDVPEELHPLVPLAEKWGIVEDNWNPMDLLYDVPREELEDLVNTVQQVFDSWGDEDLLGDWFYRVDCLGEERTEVVGIFTEFHLFYERAEWLLRQWGDRPNKPGEND